MRKIKEKNQHLSQVSRVQALQRYPDVFSSGLPKPRHRLLTFFIENFVICCDQVTDFFGSKCCFASAVPSRSPRNLGSLADLAISVSREASVKTMLPWLPLSSDVPNLNLECWHFCFLEIICELLRPIWEISQSITRCLIVALLQLGYCHSVVLLDQTSLAVTMQRTNLRSSLRTILRQQSVRNCPSCTELLCHFWLAVDSDHRPTHMNIRVLRRACPTTGLQA